MFMPFSFLVPKDF